MCVWCKREGCDGKGREGECIVHLAKRGKLCWLGLSMCLGMEAARVWVSEGKDEGEKGDCLDR